MNATNNHRELQSIQRKLDRWELDHLREHAAQLAAQLDAAHAEIESLKRDLLWAYSDASAADARADMFMDFNRELMDQSALRAGLTKDGRMIVLSSEVQHG